MQQFYRNGRLIEWDPERPVITCLMSVYNGETYLREAMDSILDQTYTNFEFLIINDGSTDGTVPIIESYNDPRIRLVHNEENIGLTKSLNKGIDLAKGEYIARMDADDISLPERFEKQLKVIKTNKKIKLVADEQQYTIGLKKKINYDEIDVELLFHNCIKHSSVFFFRQIKQTKVYYNIEFKRTQDYELWTSDIFKNAKMFVGKELVKIRQHDNRISSLFKQSQDEYVSKVHKRLLNELGIESQVEELQVFRRMLEPSPGYSQFFIVHVNSIIEKIIRANKKMKMYNHDLLIERLQSLLKHYLINGKHNIYSYFLIIKQIYSIALAK